MKNCYIVCKKSSKTDKTYLVLIVNGVCVTFDRLTIERVAMTAGYSNIDLANLPEGEGVDIL